MNSTFLPPMCIRLVMPLPMVEAMSPMAPMIPLLRCLRIEADCRDGSNNIKMGIDKD